MKPLNRISTTWSSELAYCIGLISIDGCLSKDGRHITLVSKDYQQIATFKACLNIGANIRPCGRGGATELKYFRLQFGDVNFYRFLLSLGLTPAKSKTIGRLNIPAKYFKDFLRGSFDGDGTLYSYWDERWKSSYLFYLSFISASACHLEWIQDSLQDQLGVKGKLKPQYNTRAHELRYAKSEAKVIIDFLYYKRNIPKLERKYRKVYNALVIDELNSSARVLKLVTRLD